VESGAILAGHGTIAGDVIIQNGGHLAPGPVAETLGVGNLVMNQNSILDYVLNTPGVVAGVNTLVNVTGKCHLECSH
jgi:fibronectin-binding autotransporter adhesin